MSGDITTHCESSNGTQTELSDFSAETLLFERLTDIEMIGEKRARRIIKGHSYDSIQDIREASEQELTDAESVGTEIVTKLKEQTDQDN